MAAASVPELLRFFRAVCAMGVAACGRCSGLWKISKLTIARETATEQVTEEQALFAAS